MDQQIDEKDYYIIRKSELLKKFDEDVERWRPILVSQFGSDFANTILREGREEFEVLIPQIPYIGGDESWTSSLVESVRCLAFYKAMKKRGKTAEEAGKILYDAVMARINEPQTPVSPSELSTPEQLMERRKNRAELSQMQRHAEGYVCELVIGDGKEFDYGYDFIECAAQKFYHVQGADEFLPFYCFLDFPKSKVFGLGLTRTMTLAEGYEKCNHRFKSGGTAELEWPPHFVKHE
jgi:hypothetical protein